MEEGPAAPRPLVGPRRPDGPPYPVVRDGPPSNWREGPARAPPPARAAPAVIIDWGKPYDEEFPGMAPEELDAAIRDDACFPGDLGFGSRVTSDRFS